MISRLSGESKAPPVLRGSRRVFLHQLSSAESMEDEGVEGNIAYIYAAPLVTELMREVPILDVSSELNELKQALREADKRVRLRKQVATTQNLRMLLTKGCNVLHYSGHGDTDILSFETAAGTLEKANMKFLKQLFQAGGIRTKLVFVSACHSENVGRQFVEAGVPHVVAVKTDAKITDEASRAFASSFYFALLSSHTVSDAFEIGVSSVQYDDTDAKFLLLPEHGDHQVQIFNNLPSGPYIDATPALPPSDCDNAPDHVIGRSHDIYQVVSYFSNDARFVTIRGPVGIGKTTIALKAIEYMRERAAFGLFTCVKIYKRPGVTDPNELARYLAERIKIRELMSEQQQVRDCETLADYLAEVEKRFGRILLFLDGCDESVREDSPLAPILNEIFHRTAKVHILITAERGFQTVESFPLESHGQTEKIVSVHPLNQNSVLMLLWRRSPRPLQECFDPPPRHRTEIETRVSHHRAIQKLRGHPGAILRFVRHLADCTLDDSDELLAKAEEAYAQAQVRPPILSRDMSLSSTVGLSLSSQRPRSEAARPDSTADADADAQPTRPRVAPRHRGSNTAVARPPVNTGFQAALDRALQHIEDRRCAMLWAELTAGAHPPKTNVPFSQVAEGLRRMVLSLESFMSGRCRPPAYVSGQHSPRTLTDDDLSFIQTKMVPELSSEQLMPYAMITLENFRQFSLWWGPVLDTLVRIAPEWCATSPIMVHGFVGRSTVSRWLLDKSPGVFALRFSESYAGFLVISFVDDHADRSLVVGVSDRRATPQSLAHCLVTVGADGCSISFNNTAERRYPDLRSLVLDCAKLRRVFPGHRKEDVFVPLRLETNRQEASPGTTHIRPQELSTLTAGTTRPPVVRMSPALRHSHSLSPSPTNNGVADTDNAPECTGSRPS